MGENEILQGILDIKDDIGDIKEDIGHINGTLVTQTKACDQRFKDIHGRIKHVENKVDSNEGRLDKAEKFNIGIQHHMNGHIKDKEAHYQADYPDKPFDRIKRHKKEITIGGVMSAGILFFLDSILPTIVRYFGG